MLPNLHAPERATPADLAACREMIRTGSRSFHMASRFLPEDIRGGACAFYAFCRLSDDSVDQAQGGADAVVRLSRRLDAIYGGAPAGPADRAMADAVERFAIPRAVFDALLEGLAWDAAGRSYETLDDLYEYAARVAGSVGAMMAALMNVRAPDLAARACDLGVAMQLTNIARDVGEDARLGRIYLPRTWLREAGICTDMFLQAPAIDDRLRSLVARLLQHADALYRNADAGIAALPPRYRPAIAAARLLYAEIGRRIADSGHNSVDVRAVVPASRKIVLMARALAFAKRPAGPDLSAPALPQTQFLVDAVCQSAPAASVARPDGARRAAWAIELLAALEDRPRRAT